MAEAAGEVIHSNPSSSKANESNTNNSRTIELKRKIREVEKVILLKLYLCNPRQMSVLTNIQQGKILINEC
jgi:hypothetical protein